jgi:sigma-B regulation protein RsbU (phosphoserine phosphatase)
MTPTLERIRENLTEKRSDMHEWIRTAPSHRKTVLLGPSTEQAVHSHIKNIEGSIAEIESDTFGICEVCQESVETERLEIDYTCCVCIDHFSVEEIRDLENELELAQTIQKTLLPQGDLNIPGLDIAAYSRPAQLLGGDYFDFVELKEGKYYLAIADVAGHGVSASLHMASIQAMLRSIAPTSQSPSEIANKIHRLFVHNIQFTTFVSLFLGAFDPDTRSLAYSNAGHNPPLVFQTKKDGKISSSCLNPTGAAIGLIEDMEYGEQILKLHKTDLLVMYTDGLTEAMDQRNEMFGVERLVEIIEGTYPAPPKEVIQKIKEGLEAFIEGRSLADDTTIVVCKVI